MIESHGFQNRVMISSTELYDALGRDRKDYYKWRRRHFTHNFSLESPRDYVLFKRQNKKTRLPVEFYLSISLAKAILVREGSVVAKKLRYFIEEKLEGTVVVTVIEQQAYSPIKQKRRLNFIHPSQLRLFA